MWKAKKLIVFYPFLATFVQAYTLTGVFCLWTVDLHFLHHIAKYCGCPFSVASETAAAM